MVNRSSITINVDTNQEALPDNISKTSKFSFLRRTFIPIIIVVNTKYGIISRLNMDVSLFLKDISPFKKKRYPEIIKKAANALWTYI